MNEKEVSPVVNETSGCLALLVRLFWMMIGNMILLGLAVGIHDDPSPGLTFKDVIYGITVLTMVAARFIDIKFLHGLTVYNTPASSKHLYRYIGFLMAGAFLLWGLASWTK